MTWNHKVLQFCLIVLVLSCGALAEASETLKYYVLATEQNQTKEAVGEGRIEKTFSDGVLILGITVDVTQKETGGLEIRMTIDQVTEWASGQYYIVSKEPTDIIEFEFKVDDKGIVSEEKEGTTPEQEKLRHRYRDEALQICKLLFAPLHGEKDEKQCYLEDFDLCDREYGPGWERYWSTHFKKVLRAEQIEKTERDVGSTSDRRWIREKKMVIVVQGDDLFRYAREHLAKEQSKEDTQE